MFDVISCLVGEVVIWLVGLALMGFVMFKVTGIIQSLLRVRELENALRRHFGLEYDEEIKAFIYDTQRHELAARVSALEARKKRSKKV